MKKNLRYHIQVKCPDEPSTHWERYYLTYEDLFAMRPDLAPAVKRPDFISLELITSAPQSIRIDHIFACE